ARDAGQGRIHLALVHRALDREADQEHDRARADHQRETLVLLPVTAQVHYLAPVFGAGACAGSCAGAGPGGGAVPSVERSSVKSLSLPMRGLSLASGIRFASAAPKSWKRMAGLSVP